MNSASTTEGKVISCRAAVCWAPGQPLSVETIEVDPPKKGEVRIKVLYNSLCHSDLHVIDGKIEAMYPVILGHEATAVVESVGEGVDTVQTGDVVIPLFTPQCNKCRLCKRSKVNLCEKSLVSTALCGTMDDGTTRFHARGKSVFHFLDTSTFSEYSVVRETALAKIDPSAPLDRVCLVGCALATGVGAAINTAKVEVDESVAVWGLGAVGLSAVVGARLAKAAKIVVIDMKDDKFPIARQMGATDCVNPKDCPPGKKFSDWLVETFGYFDRTIECVGNVDCMVQAVDTVHVGWGVAAVVGLAPVGKTMDINPIGMFYGKTITGSVFGGWEKAAEAVQQLVDKVVSGEVDVNPLVTHEFRLEQVNVASDLLRKAECIRCVIQLA